jgi:hypothetical protein
VGCRSPTEGLLSGTSRRLFSPAALSLARRYMILDFNPGIGRILIEVVSMGFECHGNLDRQNKGVVNV